jgi:hypothetical protein
MGYWDSCVSVSCARSSAHNNSSPVTRSLLEEHPFMPRSPTKCLSESREANMHGLISGTIKIMFQMISANWFPKFLWTRSFVRASIPLFHMVSSEWAIFLRFSATPFLHPLRSGLSSHPVQRRSSEATRKPGIDNAKLVEWANTLQENSSLLLDASHRVAYFESVSEKLSLARCQLSQYP